jgi:hypothetical protein
MRRISHKFWVFLFFTAIILFFIPNKAFAFIDKENTQKIFSLGRGAGASYYHLTDLCDKARFKPYSALKKDYNDTFQSLNIMDVILNDLETNTNSHILLNKLRINFYNSLKDQDLNEISLLCIREAYISYYENLAKDIQSKFSSGGSWLFALGFYSSFQMESLNSSSESKLLISGFSKILNSNPFSNLPETVLTNLKTINNLDKTYISDTEIACLKQNIIKITEYFDSYPQNYPFAEIKKLTGNWQGILIDPENQRHKIKLIVNDNTNIKMDIDGIAQNILISDVKLIDNYFTFMFKPFGNEKLYIKFNAKISNNTFAGEVVDVLGQKGNWLLSKAVSN